MPFYVAAAATVIAAGVSAYGEVSSANAASDAAKYNAKIAQDNAQIAQQNANYAGAAGAAQAEQAALQTRAKVGGIIANQAAGNIDINSESATDVQSSAHELGKLNADTIKSNAARQAYGYQVQGFNDSAQSTLDLSNAANDITAGDISAGGTVLGGLGSASGDLAKYGGFSLNGSTTPTVDSTPAGSIGSSSAYPSN